MSNIMQLKKFREEILLKMDKSEKDKRFNDFIKGLNKVDLKLENFSHELDKLRGRS